MNSVNRCHKTEAKYVCPSCKVPYCSTSCYSKHNSQCTEAFFSKLVFEELSLRQKEDKAKNEAKIAKMLKKAQETIVEPLDVAYDLESEATIPDEYVLEELSHKLERGESIDLASLPKSIQHSLLRDIANGELNHSLAVWTPWWIMPEEVHKQKVQPIILEERPDFSIPCLLRSLQDGSFKDVKLPVTLSPTIPYNLLEVVFLYCLCMRLYNGDVEDAGEEIVSTIIQLSSVLSKGAVYSSCEELVVSLLCNEAIARFIGDIPHKETKSTELQLHESVSKTALHYTFHDVLLILQIPHYVVDALGHCFGLMQSMKHQSKELRPIIHKLAFFITFARKMDSGHFWLLHQEMEVVLQSMDEESIQKKRNHMAKPFIQEIPM